MIRVVLFDFGGVLAEEGFQQGLREIGRRAGVSPDTVLKAGERHVYESGYVTGRAAERTFWDRLRADTGVSLNDDEMREVILSRFLLRPEVMSWVGRTRASGRVTG